MKKISASILVLVMLICSTFGVGAYATEEEPKETSSEAAVVKNPPTIKNVTATEAEDGKFKIVVTVVDNGSGIAEVAVTDANKKKVSSKANDEANDNGTYSFRLNANAEYYVFVYDIDGETGTKDGFFIDRKLPVISNISYDKDTYTKDNVKVDFDVKDTSGIDSVGVKNSSGEAVKVKDDGSNSYSFEAEKNDTYVILAKDKKGNVSEKSKVVIDKIDKTVPEVKVNLTKPEGVSKEPVTFQYEVTDDIGIGSVTVDGKVVIELEKPRKSYSNEFTASKSGEIMIEVKDLAGNTAIETVDVGIIDTKIPVFTKQLTIDDIAGLEAKASVAVEDDSELTYEWFITGGVSTDWGKLDVATPEVIVTGLKRATTYTLKVVVKDEAGNSITDSRSFTTLNDNTTTAKKDNTMMYIIIAVCVFLLIVSSVVLIIYLMFRRKNNGGDDGDDGDGDDIFDEDYDDSGEYDDNGEYYDNNYDDGYRDGRADNIGSDLYRNASRNNRNGR